MKREVQVLRQELMPPRPETVLIKGATKAEVAKAAGRGVAKGKYGSVTEVLAMRGGGYVAKATLIPRPEPKHRSKNEPLPTWARVLIRIGWSIAGIVAALALFTFALSALFGALVNLPWMAILGVAGVIAIVCAVTGPGRAAVSVIVKVIVH